MYLPTVGPTRYAVEGSRCVRCAACSTVAPATFVLRDGPAMIVRPPETPGEEERADVALLICPSQAIGVRKERA
jgi:ferredoxin